MSFSVGIVGLPNVGKSTLFQALTRKKVDIANYPFCTIEPNVGIVKVPDERLKRLAVLFDSKRVIPTVIEFVDIAGLVKGAGKGEGLGNQFLSHIREVKAIVQVVRCFENPEIAHVDETVNAVRDIETINAELRLRDLDTIAKSLFSVGREVRTEKKEALLKQSQLQEIQAALSKGMSVVQFLKEHPDAKDVLTDLQLLSIKPTVYVLNSDSGKVSPLVIKTVEKTSSPFLVMNLKEELDAAGLTPEEIKELKVKEQKIPQLIVKVYEALDLITFFTTTQSAETRAWTVPQGTKVPQAAGVVHSDFKDKFIKAAVIQWSKLLEAGGLTQAVNKGLIRTQGKDYVVQDGDVIEVKHG